MKIGEDDTLAQWHTKRCSMQTRAPMYYLLDERTRLAGCHMIRDAVERADPRGGESPLQAVHAARRSRTAGATSSRASASMPVPGRYRSPASPRLTLRPTSRTCRRRRAARLRSCTRLRGRVDRDGPLDDSTSRLLGLGLALLQLHPVGAAGEQWIHFTQTLICNDKINDGAYCATELLLPGRARTSATPGARPRPWGCLMFTTSPASCARSRARCSRAATSRRSSPPTPCAGNVAQGGGIDQYGQNSRAITNFEIAAQGQGAKYVLDGSTTAPAMFNPEGDMGDVEMWELIEPMVYLGGAGSRPHRPAAAVTAAAPRSRRCLLAQRTQYLAVENIGCGGMLTSPGIFGGYPGGLSTSTTSSAPTSSSAPSAARPTRSADGSLRRGGAARDRRRARVRAGRVHDETPVGDRRPLPRRPARRLGGLGDPLLRPPERSSRRRARTICCRGSPTRCTASCWAPTRADAAATRAAQA